jgi:hypothetical protein
MLKISEIHIFQTIDPKITNIMSLESWERVESIGTIIFYSFYIKFELNFKLI